MPNADLPLLDLPTILSVHEAFYAHLRTASPTPHSIAQALLAALRVPLNGAEIYVFGGSEARRTNGVEWRLWATSAKATDVVSPEPYETNPSFCTCKYHAPEDPAHHIIQEPALAVAIWCTSLTQKHLARQILDSLRQPIAHLLHHGQEVAAYKTSRSYARTAMLFPRGSDDQLAYDLLHTAKAISPHYTSLQFWRISRNNKSLQRIAEYKNPPGDFTPEQIPNWDLPRERYIWEDPFFDENSIPLPEVLLALPRGTVERKTRRELLECIGTSTGFRLNDSDTLDVTCPNGTQQLLDVYFNPSAILTATKQRRVLASKLSSLLSRQSIPETGFILVLCSNLDFDDSYTASPKVIDFKKVMPGPFQVILTVVATDVTSLNIIALQRVQQALRIADVHFDLISLARRHLRTLADFLTQLSRTKDLPALSLELSNGLRRLIGTGTFVLLDHEKGRVLLTSPDLRSFHGTPLIVPQVQREGIYSCNNVLNDSDPAIQKVAAFVRSSLLAEFDAFKKSPPEAYATRSTPRPTPPLDLALLPIYNQVGMTGVKIDRRHSLLVFQSKAWKLRALEGITLQVVASLLRPTLAPHLTTALRQRSLDIAPDTDLLALLRSGEEVDAFLQHLVVVVESKWHKATAMVVAIDHDATFFKLLTGVGVVGEEHHVEMSLNEPSLISKCVKANATVVASRKTESNLLCRDGDEVPYHHLLATREGSTIVALPIPGPQEGVPRAVLLLDLPLKRNHEVEAAISSATQMAQIAGIWLERRAQDCLAEVRRNIQPELDALRKTADLRGPRKWSEINSEPKSFLPLSIRRVFTPDFREHLKRVLDTVRRITLLRSLTVRVRDRSSPDHGNNIWLLAHSADGEPSGSYIFDPSRNVHSYCLQQDQMSPKVFLPDVRHMVLVRRLYPDLNYHRERSDTVAELCFNLRHPDASHLIATFNVENAAFDRIWLFEDILTDIAATIRLEVFTLARRTATSDHFVSALAKDYATQSAHAILRSARTLDYALKRLLATVPGESQSAATPLTTATRSLRQATDVHLSIVQREMESVSVSQHTDILQAISHVLLEARKALLMGPEPVRDINIHEQVQCAPTTDAPAISLSSQFPGLFYKLLLEQSYTLNRLALDRQHVVNLKCGLRPAKANWVIDILNDAQPDADTRALSEYLFWYLIDKPGRQAEGTTGAGLMVLGSMLRNIGVFPLMHPQPTHDIEMLYGKEYGGLWVELILQGGKQ